MLVVIEECNKDEVVYLILFSAFVVRYHAILVVFFIKFKGLDLFEWHLVLVEYKVHHSSINITFTSPSEYEQNLVNFAKFMH